MSNATWDKKEIKKLALESGKPLEVQCAEAFLRERWKVRLGTFFTDFASEKIRELDFLAQRDFPFKARNLNQDVIDWNLRLRILGSCKGFRQKQSPATYSVFSNSLTVEAPSFICYECGLHGRTVADAMRQRTANNFLSRAGLLDTQQVVGFDILQREETAPRKGKNDSTLVEYSRVGDRDLYEGLDSAVKAALFWYREDRHQQRMRIGGDDRGNITLNIPLLISSFPFWNVSIDKGAEGEPELKSSGFHVGLYPSGDEERPPEPVMTILWEVGKLQELTQCFNRLIDYFVDETKLAVEKV